MALNVDDSIGYNLARMTQQTPPPLLSGPAAPVFASQSTAGGQWVPWKQNSTLAISGICGSEDECRFVRQLAAALDPDQLTGSIWHSAESRTGDQCVAVVRKNSVRAAQGRLSGFLYQAILVM